MEPLMIAYAPFAIPPSDRPRTRLRLAQFLENGREANRDRVVIYDITRSGVGYLYSAFDAGLSPLAWRLARAFGDVMARIVETEEEMLSALEEGRANLAFGIVGSASVRQRAKESGVVLVPMEDYSIIAMRTALIPKAARSPALAELFLAFLLSEEAQGRLGEAALLRPDAARPERSSVPVSIIPLGAASLIHTDQRKRGRFLDTWIQLVLKP
jgi:iron(III) transport system substrate-binding protein